MMDAGMIHDSRYAPREEKAAKILALLKKHCSGDLSKLDCLDVGCGDGGITARLAPYFHHVIGIDVEPNRVRSAESCSHQKNLAFSVASAHHIPFNDSSFDIVVCAQVYEHVQDQQALASEIWRVIRPGGICFFSGPNRLKLMEEHYWLPFLSWLPRPLANRYLWVFRQVREYDAFPRFYWELRKLWSNFEIKNAMLDLLRNPDRYAVHLSSRYRMVIRILPDWLLNLLTPFYPNYNWILTKPNDETI
jgi:ubiquinone/menaquinone biosynthesis C-methylase UbiE